jgi:voltage-gated potassium channel Kch
VVLAGIGEAVGALVAIVLVGRYLLNILFGLLARFGAREVMTAAALLVVLGSALLMDAVGMSMALGAFIAGLLLAESNFRHELEADIEPFRGLLLGLFFMAIGMGLDLGLLHEHFLLVLGATLALLVLKLSVIGLLLRLSGLPAGQALRFASLMTAAGEFAFVLLPLAAALGLAGTADVTLFTGIAALSMVLAPLTARLLELAEGRWRAGHPEAEPDEDFDGAGGRVLVIGFGRFGQQVTQVLLAADTDLTVIDKDVEMIQSAGRFGFKVYYGDGARLDVLRAAGAADAGIICICIDDPKAALVIVEIIQAHFPLAKIHVRAFDRRHAIDLMGQNVDLVVRETFEAAMHFGRSTLQELGHQAENALAIVDDVRRRDIQRLERQKAAGMFGGVDLLTGVKVQPEPLAAPRRASRALSALTRRLLAPTRNAAPTVAE